MTYDQTALSILIFSPLVAAGIAMVLKNENALRWWTLVFTTALAAFSLPLFWHFDPSTTAPAFQFKQIANWIPAFKIHYAVGVDGISLLLVLLTTLVMPLCVLASWRYIQVR